MNTFQKFMLKPENVNIAIDIARLYHPDRKNLKIVVKHHYDWVIIEGHNIAIGIEFPVALMGLGWKIEHFKKIADEGKFRAWRFVWDNKYPSNDPDVNPILENYNVPKPTPKEMMKYYYKD